MKRIATVILLLSGPFTVAGGTGDPEAAWIEQSRQLTMQLGSELKAELTSAIAAGGPVAAIEVCRTRAPQIAARLSQESGATVGRTALRVRNPANAPDDMQRRVLEQFSDELATGKVEGPLEAVFEIKRGEQVERRYMRAIPTDAMCLTCHGKTLAPELADAIARAYPSDQATGFEQGQLRGAFSVIWSAHAPSAATSKPQP